MAAWEPCLRLLCPHTLATGTVCLELSLLQWYPGVLSLLSLLPSPWELCPFLLFLLHSLESGSFPHIGAER